MKLLLIDNYDSFTFNIVNALKQLGVTDITIVKNDKIEIEQVQQYSHIIISPGPKLPKDSGQIIEIIQYYASTKKIFGICLGHQAIVEAFGGQLFQMQSQQHGMQAVLDNVATNEILFANIESPIAVGLYHSWAAQKDNLPACLQITSEANGIIMSVQHKSYAVSGVQFHVESYLTPHGNAMLQNWLEE
jgi:anthranilate synthase component II